ncbi:MAG TPA: bacteriocin fulvocin C-related protein [Gemmatimonadaceae bacterium]|nr:bacteriocin fulvocin C-related protein [Gemmatimonadaceae bacterium]
MTLLAATAWIAIAARSPEPECVKAAAWVTEHRSTLPASLAEIAKLPMAYRRAAFAALPGKVQASLWRDQLQALLAPVATLTPVQAQIRRSVGSTLTVRQQALLREAIERFDEFTEPTTGRAALVDFSRRIDSIFEKRFRVAVFGTLGPGQTAVGSLPSEEPSFKTAGIGLGLNGFAARLWAKTRFAKNSATRAACVCNVEVQDCYYPGGCEPYYTFHCSMTEQGCGPFWLMECNGGCNL